MANKNLNQAKSAKKDEFYTQLADIENDLRHYKEHFKGKTVLCNCDDPRVSNFFHYFSYNFEQLGLKKLITTCYKNQERDLFSQNNSERAIWLEYFGDKNNNRVPDPDEIGIHYFKGDGDFRSDECIELLKQADIVVTNPPFSLFREYVAQLMKYEKKFLIIGNQNALHYKEIFPLVQQNKVWLGYNHVKEFNKPDGTLQKFGNVIWYTNLDIQKRHEDLVLYKEYSEEEYPTFDNFNAINVNKVSEIPCDYYGYMGVPDSFIEIYNPEQFEILGMSGDTDWVLKECVFFTPPTREKCNFYKHYNNTWRIQNVYLLDKNKLPIIVYSRIFIRRKQAKTYQQNEIQSSVAAEPKTEYSKN